MRPCRIGVIGLGQRIAHVLLAMAEVGWPFDVVGHLDPAPIGRPILAARDVGVGAAYGDMDAFLTGGPFDLLMIGSPNHLHLEHLLAARTAGCPVFCEKPVVRTFEESVKLARILGQEAGPPVFVGLVMRSMPIVRDVLQRVRSGELGTLVSMDATEHLHPEHGAYLARNWRRRGAWGGSFLLDKVCHDFDIFGVLAGSRPRRVASFGGRSRFRSDRRPARSVYDDGARAYQGVDPGWMGVMDPFDSDMDVADHQVALVDYENGFRLSFHCNSHAALQERRWMLAGAEGALIADLVRNRLLVRRAMSRGRPERIDYGGRTADNHNGADQAMALDLWASVERGAAFPAAVEDALEAGLAVMAVDQAQSQAEVVDCRPLFAEYDQAWGR